MFLVDWCFWKLFYYDIGEVYEIRNDVYIDLMCICDEDLVCFIFYKYDLNLDIFFWID